MPYDDPDGNKNEYVEIYVREPKMVHLGMEIINDEECIITAMSSRRAIYKSKDQGVTWEFDHRAGYVEYWTTRAKDTLIDWRMFLWIALKNIKLFILETWQLMRQIK